MMKKEDGFGTVEVIILLAIVVGIALIFQDQITTFTETLINTITQQNFIV